jgi:hypothetical protein
MGLLGALTVVVVLGYLSAGGGRPWLQTARARAVR